MGFADFVEKLGQVILGLRRPGFSEYDNHIKAIYAALQKAENDLKNYERVIYETRKIKPRGKEGTIYSPKDLNKELKEQRLQNKVAVLSQLKREINSILREY